MAGNAKMKRNTKVVRFMVENSPLKSGRNASGTQRD
jgi:hypothetical protein